MADKGQEAHNKGEQDLKESGGLANPNPITEFFHPTYNPPKGCEKEYEQGWDNAKNQKK